MPTNVHLELIHRRRRCVGLSSTDSYMKGGYGGDAYAQSPALDLQVDSIPIPEVWSVSPCVLGRKKNVATRVGSDQSGQSARGGPCAPSLSVAPCQDVSCLLALSSLDSSMFLLSGPLSAPALCAHVYSQRAWWFTGCDQRTPCPPPFVPTA